MQKWEGAKQKVAFFNQYISVSIFNCPMSWLFAQNPIIVNNLQTNPTAITHLLLCIYFVMFPYS